MNVYVKLMQSQSPNSHKLIAMQFKQSIWKGETSIIVQLIRVDDVEDMITPTHAIVLEKFIDLFQPLPYELPSEKENGP